MAILTTTTFDNVGDGAAWPSPWAWRYGSNSNAKAYATSGFGRIRLQGGGQWTDKGTISHTTAPSNFELTFRYRATPDSFPQIMFRSQGTTGEVSSSYVVVFDWDGDFTLIRNVNWSATQLASVPNKVSYNTWYRVRLRAEGSSIKARVWRDGTSEPSAWDISVTDSTFSTGQLNLHAGGGSSTAGFDIDWDDIVVDDLQASSTPVTIPPSAYPTATDADGTANDRVNITAVTGVIWTVNGVDYTTSQAVPYTQGVNTTVTARAASGYVLSGTSSWTLTFTNYVPPTPVSVPTGSYPTATDVDGTSNDKVNLKAVTGVIWTVDGVDYTTTTSVPFTRGTSTTVTARAASGYVLSGTTSWTLSFTNIVGVTVPAGSVPTATDTNGTANDRVNLRAVTGVIWTVDGVDYSTSTAVPYTKGVNTTVTARAASGYRLDGTSSWTLTFTNISPTSVPAGSVPTATDVDGTANDKVNLTAVTGVIWTVNGVDYTTTQSVPYTNGTSTTVTARAASGYILSGTASWTLNFTNIVGVTVPAGSVPTAADPDGVSSDKVRLTAVPGVIWTVDGVDYTSTQAVPYTKGINTTVTARAAAGYRLDGTSSWTLVFTNLQHITVPAGSEPVASDQDGTTLDSIRITAVPGIIWTVDGIDYTTTQNVPYAKADATTVTARAASGYVLSGNTRWLFTFSDYVPPELSDDYREVIRLARVVEPPAASPVALTGYTYAAFRLNGDGTESLAAASLPLRDVQINRAPLNTPPTFTWSIEPEYLALRDETGTPVLRPWDTAIYAFTPDGQVAGAGILSRLSPQGSKLTGTMIGWTEYVAGMPWTSAVLKKYNADPGHLISQIWSTVQSQPRGNVGLSVPSITTGVKIGAKVTKGTDQPKATSSTKTTTTKTQITTVTTTIEKKLYADKNIVTTSKTTRVKNRSTGATSSRFDRTIKTTSKDRRQTTVTQTLDASGKVLTSKTVTTTLAQGTSVELLVTTVESDEPFLLADYATEDLKQVLDELFEVGSIDYREEHTMGSDGNVKHRLVLGYPRLGRRRTDIMFNLQVNATEMPAFTIDADDYASEVLVLGAGDGDKMVRARAVNPRASRLRKVKVLKAKGIGRTSTAQRYAQNRSTAYDTVGYEVEQLTVNDHAMAPMLSWESGDEVRLTGDGMWAGQIDVWVRILSTTYNPEQPHIATLEVIRADKVESA